MGRFTEQKGHITARRTYALLKGALLTQLSALPFEQVTLTDRGTVDRWEQLLS